MNDRPTERTLLRRCVYVDHMRIMLAKRSRLYDGAEMGLGLKLIVGSGDHAFPPPASAASSASPLQCRVSAFASEAKGEQR